MATFGREDGEGTVIGTHVKLSGVLSDPNDILILGKLDGEVNSNRTVTVGDQAQVKGPITASKVIVSGTVRGNINSKERLELLPKGNVTGNVETKDLVIHSGSVFNGRSTMVAGETPEPETVMEKEEPEAPEAPIPAKDEAPLQPPVETPEKVRRMWPPIRLAFPPKREKASGPSGLESRRESEGKPKEAPAEKEKPTYEVE